jgi:hypothetical protein
MYDYLNTVAPDYDGTLNVTPQNVMVEKTTWKQNVQETDDGTEQVLSLGGPHFLVSLQWTSLNESDAGTITDFYNDSAKGKGFARSFKWDHPTDEHTYVVKFRSAMQKRYVAQKGVYREISEIKLKVIGRIADA